MTIQHAMELAVAQHRAGNLAAAEAAYSQVLQQNPEYPDALHLLGVIYTSVGKPVMAVDLIGKAIALHRGHAIYYLNLGCALDSLGRLDESINAYQAALALKPDYAQALCNLGNAYGKKGQPTQAIFVLRRALAIQPDLPEALNNLGNALQAMGDPDQAIAALRRAITVRPDYAEAHSNLGKALMHKRLLSEAVASSRRAIELRPDLSEAYNNLGNALFLQGEIPQATNAFRQAVAQAHHSPLAHFNLGLMLLLGGDFQNGLAEYEWRLRAPEFTPPVRPTTPRWDGSDLAGRRILLHAEQGLGDCIQFARYIPLVKERGGRIAVVCDGVLHRLLSQLTEIDTISAPHQPLPAHDVQCPLPSLPYVFKTDLHSIPAKVPYLSADMKLSEVWRDRLAGETRRKIGLVWAGRASHPNDRERSIPPALLAPLQQIEGIRWISLQKDNPSGQIVPGLDLSDWTGELTDLADAAALMSQLDLVITVDTAAAHLAGATGKPVWMLLPTAPDWRWMLNRADSPWYPTMRIFRQSQGGDWTVPLGNILEALKT